VVNTTGRNGSCPDKSRAYAATNAVFAALCTDHLAVAVC
jgi:hypothetical protein